MSEPTKGLSCGLGCWALAAGAGFLTLVLLLVLGNLGWMQAIFLAGVVFFVLGALFSWIFCGALPQPAVGADAPGTTVTPAAPTRAAKAATTPTAAASVSEAKPAVATASETADAEAGASVKPSKALSGEDELRHRKGAWKYEGDTAAAPAAAGAVAEGAGRKPKTLKKAPAGGGDDLKKIKGIGPKLATLCNSMGFYTFAQIAGWSAEEVTWVDQNLEGFKGRVTRDEWVAQAKLLASGAETEFSKKVDKGGVY